MGWHDIFEVHFSFSKNLIMTILFNRDTSKGGLFPAKLQVEGALLQKNFFVKTYEYSKRYFFGHCRRTSLVS